jgi:hypothetical protein
MPDKRHHRGPHPDDVQLFAEAFWPRLQSAVSDMAWLLTRGYAPQASLKLVGDNYRLDARQRLAVMRSSCSDQALHDRLARRQLLDALPPLVLAIDGFNLITSVEAALAGGVILCGRDGCYRDMASMHGSYRKVQETVPALLYIGQRLARVTSQRILWWLDRPVSNSGRLAAVMREVAREQQWLWEVELVDSPDHLLISHTGLTVSADSAVLDRCGAWINLAAEVIARCVPSAYVVPMAARPAVVEPRV